MKYYIYRESEVAGDYIKTGIFEPAASDDCCYFGEVKFWSKENGFLKGQFKIGEYWVISECEKRMLEEEEAARWEANYGGDEDDGYVPHRHHFECNME
jgi:hypothetical protein